MPVRRAAPAVLGAALVAALASACAGPASPAPVPSATDHVSGAATPDVTGVVVVQDGGPVLTRASDPYFEGMALATADPSVVSEVGTLTVDDLADGDVVEVWLTPDAACAESSPVQCDVLTIRVGG